MMLGSLVRNISNKYTISENSKKSTYKIEDKDFCAEFDDRK